MRSSLLWIGACLLAHDLAAQQLGPAAVVSGGGGGAQGGMQLSYTLGQVGSATYAAGPTLITAGVQQPDVLLLRLNVRVLLGGPFMPNVGLMQDSLRAQGLLPLLEPYTAAGYVHVGAGGGETTDTGVLGQTGPDAVVDWVVLELRPQSDMGLVACTRSALVQRDGDVVDNDGLSPVAFPVTAGAYHVVVRHRNHLPVMTASASALSSMPTSIDLSNGTVSVYGTDAQRVDGIYRVLWPGNVIPDGLIRYSGASNDRDPILQAIGGAVPTAVTTGYHPTDVNMDGTVKYSGQANDRDVILQTIGGSVPTATRTEQLPQP